MSRVVVVLVPVRRAGCLLVGGVWCGVVGCCLRTI